MKSEKNKLACEREHQVKAREHLSIQQQITAISKDIPKALQRAKYVQFIVHIESYSFGELMLSVPVALFKFLILDDY